MGCVLPGVGVARSSFTGRQPDRETLSLVLDCPVYLGGLTSHSHRRPVATINDPVVSSRKTDLNLLWSRVFSSYRLLTSLSKQCNALCEYLPGVSWDR